MLGGERNSCVKYRIIIIIDNNNNRIEISDLQ